MCFRAHAGSRQGKNIKKEKELEKLEKDKELREAEVKKIKDKLTEMNDKLETLELENDEFAFDLDSFIQNSAVNSANLLKNKRKYYNFDHIGHKLINMLNEWSQQPVYEDEDIDSFAVRYNFLENLKF